MATNLDVLGLGQNKQIKDKDGGFYVIESKNKTHYKSLENIDIQLFYKY